MNGAVHVDDITSRVREVQIRQLYKETWSGLAGIMIIMVSAGIILWPVIPHWKFLIWSGILVLLSMGRCLLLIMFRKKIPAGTEIGIWARYHVIGTVASGVMWGLPAIFLWPHNSPVHQLIWPLCIVGLSASAIAKFYSWKPSYLPYIFLTLVPLSVRLLFESELTYVVLGILGFIFLFIMYQTGEVMYTSNSRLLEAGIRNELLNEILSKEKQKEEDLNTKLQQEIAERTNSQNTLQKQYQELEQLNMELENAKDGLETANRNLARAIGEIKHLSGMLPICVSCKKIRNDSGYWEQIEAYIHDHSEAEFSHSLCPE